MSQNYGLALHTSSRDLGLAISNFSGVSRWQSWPLDRDLANYLHLYLAQFLEPQTWSELAFLAVAKGPGSFTSLRLGLVTVRTLAQQLNIPVFSLSSLEVFAYSQTPPLNLALQMKASQGKVYGALYQILAPPQPPQVYERDRLYSLEEWQETLKRIPFDYQLLELGEHLGDTVPSLLELAYYHWRAGKRPPWAEALPFYT